MITAELKPAVFCGLQFPTLARTLIQIETLER
jgi:hypothetical protein